MVAPVIPWLRARISQYGIEFRPDVGSIRDSPRAIITRRLFSPSRRKIGRGDQPINRMDRFSPRQRKRERFETREPREMGTVLEIDRSRQRERERGSVEDGDDRLHKRLERESLRRGFCARVPDGWRHCRALKNTPRVGGVQLSPLFSVFIPPPRKFLQPRIFKK